MAEQERITANHRIMGGVPCVRGTRIPAATVGASSHRTLRDPRSYLATASGIKEATTKAPTKGRSLLDP
ncbi:DUF433 domain-containing protein [Gordonia sp. (in: high G+C Gram-positive bacteria)]|uniref:DUF433 domain-containing protein n=1 Tax=Gordonia sp. (in: high G+C Gram-positive bacteria) TaxID=84139 RepID=UPI001D2CA1B0|nr:DUF433 domain-containing protein [Gordonia sp. (in: high G+C Gram-positive bacteria)]